MNKIKNSDKVKQMAESMATRERQLGRAQDDVSKLKEEVEDVSRQLVEVSRTLGSRRRSVFWRVGLPLGRPAIAVGVSLALMETLNDIGASEFLGARTLTVSVYSTWINRTDLPGAPQISLAMLAMVVALVLFERWARRNQRYNTAAQKPRAMQPERLVGGRAVLAFAVCAAPILLGFVAPGLYLVSEAYKRYQFAGISGRIAAETLNTVIVSLITTVVVLGCGLIVAYAARLHNKTAVSLAARASTLGYAVPGTVLAIGLLPSIGLFDQAFAHAAETLFDVSTGLVLLGSGAALIYAYSARFMAIATQMGAAPVFARLPQAASQTPGRLFG